MVVLQFIGSSPPVRKKTTSSVKQQSVCQKNLCDLVLCVVVSQLQCLEKMLVSLCVGTLVNYLAFPFNRRNLQLLSSQCGSYFCKTFMGLMSFNICVKCD